MRYQDTKEFRKSLTRLPKAIQIQVLEAIESIEEANTMNDIVNFKTLKGYRNYARIRVGNYRIGLFWDGAMFLIESVGTRGDFYKTYPPK